MNSSHLFRQGLFLFPLFALAACGGSGPTSSVGVDGSAYSASLRGREARRTVTPDELADKPLTTVRQTLGKPTMTRKEPPAEVWQYAGNGCVLDITFYPRTGAASKDAEDMKSEYLESRDMEGRKIDNRTCLEWLATRP